MIVQRYARYLQSVLSGSEPLIVTGPRFKGYACEDAGHRPYWRMLSGFVKELREACRVAASGRRLYAVQDVAELMLSEGIVQALWVVGTPGPTPFLPPMDERWRLSVEALAVQVPTDYHGPDDLAGDMLELLDGMIGPEYYRTMFGAHDDVCLEPQQIVV